MWRRQTQTKTPGKGEESDKSRCDGLDSSGDEMSHYESSSEEDGSSCDTSKATHHKYSLRVWDKIEYRNPMNLKMTLTATVVKIGDSNFRSEKLAVRTELTASPLVKDVNYDVRCVKSKHSDAPPTNRRFNINKLNLIRGQLSASEIAMIRKERKNK